MAAAPPLLSLESGTERGHSCPLFYGTRTLFRSSMERGHSCPLFYGTRTLLSAIRSERVEASGVHRIMRRPPSDRRAKVPSQLGSEPGATATGFFRFRKADCGYLAQLHAKPSATPLGVSYLSQPAPNKRTSSVRSGIFIATTPQTNGRAPLGASCIYYPARDSQTIDEDPIGDRLSRLRPIRTHRLFDPRKRIN